MTTYIDFLKTANCGILFVKMLYPLSRLRSVVNKSDFTHIGFYSITSDFGGPAVVVKFIDVFDGILTPSWYKSDFMLDELLEDKLVEKIIIKPFKGSSKIFNQLVLDLTYNIPKLGIEDLICESFNTDNEIINDSDVLLSFIHAIETNEDYTLTKHDRVYSFNQLECETIYFDASFYLTTPHYSLEEVMNETQSALFIEKNNIAKIATIGVKLISENDKLRRNIAQQMLLPSDESIIRKMQKLVMEFFTGFYDFVDYLDESFVFGEINKTVLRQSVEKLQKTQKIVDKEFNLNTPKIEFNNLEKVDELQFTPSENFRETNLLHLNQLLHSIIDDCQQNHTNISIPINDVIEIVNRLSQGTQIPPIQKLETGSYSGIIVSQNNFSELTNFQLPSTNIKLIPTTNAQLSHLTEEQLFELNQTLNKRNGSKFGVEKFNQLRTKVTREIAERKRKS